jgi:hypothetical protein
LSYAKKLGKRYTTKEFRSLLLSATNDMTPYLKGGISLQFSDGSKLTLDYPSYKGKLGAGYVDAYKLLLQIEGTPCLPVQKGVEVKVALDQFFGPAASNLTYTKVTVSDDARATLGIVGDPYVRYGKLFIQCENEGSAKISVSAIAGGSEVAGQGTAQIGGTEFTREISILSRQAAVSENGGWL